MKNLLIASLLLSTVGFTAAQVPAPMTKNPVVAADQQEKMNDKSAHKQIMANKKADRANLKAAKASGDANTVAAEKARIQQESADAKAAGAQRKSAHAREKQDRAMTK